MSFKEDVTQSPFVLTIVLFLLVGFTLAMAQDVMKQGRLIRKMARG